MTIDYQKLAQEKFAQSTPDVRAQVAALGTRNADVWIDGSDRVVKWAQDLDVTQDGQTIHESITYVITAFDVPVDVQAPPADQVWDLGAAPLQHDTV